ncbi:hypothetical protein V2J09_007873 [Rumex salicifolius]
MISGFPESQAKSLINGDLFAFASTDSDICRHFYGTTQSNAGFDLKALKDRVDEVLEKMENLQNKLESEVQNMEKERSDLAKISFSKLDFKNYLEGDVIRPLYEAHIALRQIRIPKVQEENGDKNMTIQEDPLINYFVTEEIRKYIGAKENRHKRKNHYNAQMMHSTIGHACVLMKKELEDYMDYEVGSYCKDDWSVAQKLMINGCDPLPRRRCLTRASKTYLKPYPMNESLWKVPEARNVRWNSYKCRDFECLSSKNPKRGFTKCANCFEMDKEKLKWVINTSDPVDIMIKDVLAIKPGEIRIGLDYGVGTGTFAARMIERNVSIVSTALNLGAPFNEMIALRGLIPLYITPNQRLPFFDNTMDLIHTNAFLDGWIDFLLLDFVLFDWDRVLRPGGLLWIDRYKKHRWAIAPKSKDEVYLSAVLEKPPRSL